jgi:3'-phosphoadenosine 5'-phosphosulfate (PAPS) 3'-phosphatase
MEATTATIQLDVLLDACIKLAGAACAVIRTVQGEREQSGEGVLGAELKDESDPRTWLTAADGQAQKVVVAGLRSSFPGLDIVGEEEEEEEEEGGGVTPAPAAPTPAVPTHKGLGPDYNIPAHSQSLLLRDLCVFIDPVDGTREFVQGRIEACQCLIGIAYRGTMLHLM